MFTKSGSKEEPETPQRRLEDEIGATETLIASGARVHGGIQGQTSVRVAGFFEGEIRVESVVWIAKHGEVQGTVGARGVIIEGQITGDIEASERIEIRASGRVVGNIRCSKLAMAEGCFVQGEIKMSGEESKPLTFTERRSIAAETDEVARE
jgi:cytoskeletal protein CcmA (bactofilin family)